MLGKRTGLVKEGEEKRGGFIYAGRRRLELINKGYHCGLNDVNDHRRWVKRSRDRLNRRVGIRVFWFLVLDSDGFRWLCDSSNRCS